MEELKAALIEYLQMSSCDGKTDRKELRKKLATLIDRQYNESTDSLEKN